MKINVKSPLVEINGDEMTRIIWQLIQEQLILPYLDIELISFDLGIENRDQTDDRVPVEAAEAIKEHGVGVKCATITPNAERVKEFGLKKQWPSPNATIRGLLDGTVFRAPIVVKNIPPYVRTWKQPITIARHAYGDIYKNVEAYVEKGEARLVVENGDKEMQTIHTFHGPGVVEGVHNTDASIRAFAKTAIQFALTHTLDLWFATKDTISKTYHARFRDIFQEEVDKQSEAFEQAGISYFYTLIDDAVARVVRHEGGFLWACMNYDGDVMSDLLASGFGSLGLMTSVLVSPDGAYEFEAAHGTVQRHYQKHKRGEETSTNSTASIFAWTGALKKRGELDDTPQVVAFANNLEQAVIKTIESGIMTGDLAKITTTKNPTVATTQDFIDAVAKQLDQSRE